MVTARGKLRSVAEGTKERCRIQSSLMSSKGEVKCGSMTFDRMKLPVQRIPILPSSYAYVSQWRGTVTNSWAHLEMWYRRPMTCKLLKTASAILVEVSSDALGSHHLRYGQVWLPDQANLVTCYSSVLVPLWESMTRFVWAGYKLRSLQGGVYSHNTPHTTHQKAVAPYEKLALCIVACV